MNAMARGAARVALANMDRPAMPLKVTLALTYWCQYRCQTCNIWQKKPENELSTTELDRFFEVNEGISWLDLTGGEIFLRPDILDIFSSLSRRRRDLAIVHFATNGFLTDRIVPAVETLRRESSAQIVITVSLDGDEKLNDEIRGIRGGFRKQIETFNRLRKIPGVRVALGLTLSAKNVEAVESTFEACRVECPGLQWEDFHINVMQISSHYYSNDSQSQFAPDRTLAVKAVRALENRLTNIDLEGMLERSYLRNLEKFLTTGTTPMRCHALRSSCFIDPWGTVYPCITYSRPIGSLRESDMHLDTLWRASATNQVQREIWSGKCPQCWTACDAYPTLLSSVLRPDWRVSPAL